MMLGSRAVPFGTAAQRRTAASRGDRIEGPWAGISRHALPRATARRKRSFGNAPPSFLCGNTRRIPLVVNTRQAPENTAGSWSTSHLLSSPRHRGNIPSGELRRLPVRGPRLQPSSSRTARRAARGSPLRSTTQETDNQRDQARGVRIMVLRDRVR